MFQQSRLFVAASLVAFLCVAPYACGADMEQQVAQLEQLSAQWDKMNAATAEFAAALESIKDAGSAAANVAVVEAKGNEFKAAVEAIAPLLSAAKKFRPTPGSIPPFQDRLQAIQTKQPAQTEEWTKQTARYAKELERVGELNDLPSSFGEMFNVQAVRVLISTDGLQRVLGQGMPPMVIRYMNDKLALYQKYGAAKVADVVLKKGSPADRNSAQRAITKAMPGATVLGLSGDEGQMITIAPVEKLSDIAAALTSDLPVATDEGRHRVIVTMSSNDASSGIADGAAGQPASPGQAGGARGGKPITDTGPDWPEIETLDLPAGATVSGTVYSKMELLEAYGRDKVLFIDVTNPTADNSLRYWMRTIFQRAAGANFARGSGPHFMIGPVKDIDAFCKAITWATVVDRDDDRRIIKITIDHQKFDRWRGFVQVEIVNHDEIKQQENERYQAEAKARAEARKAREANPNARSDADRASVGSSSGNNWWSNLVFLMKYMSRPDGRSSNCSGSQLRFVGVTNFDAFCKSLDFVEIVARDDANSSLKIKVDPQKLTREAVLARVDVSQLKDFDRMDLGLDAVDAQQRRAEAAAAEKRHKQEETRRANLLRQSQRIAERIKADVAAGRQPNPADLEALKNLGDTNEGAESGPASVGAAASAEKPTAPAGPKAAANPLRKWSDPTGKFSVNARFVKKVGAIVVLEKEAGKTIEVPLVKLSDADAEYLRQLGEN